MTITVVAVGRREVLSATHNALGRMYKRQLGGDTVPIGPFGWAVTDDCAAIRSHDDRWTYIISEIAHGFKHRIVDRKSSIQVHFPAVQLPEPFSRQPYARFCRLTESHCVFAARSAPSFRPSTRLTLCGLYQLRRRCLCDRAVQQRRSNVLLTMYRRSPNPRDADRRWSAALRELKGLRCCHVQCFGCGLPPRAKFSQSRSPAFDRLLRYCVSRCKHNLCVCDPLN